jgi:SAM-dependent methyltransferase
MALAQEGLGRRDELTFRANVRGSRYGWLRLTPAYSVHLVRGLLAEHAGVGARVLDPFCGTGTTALVCAEAGMACETTDINPFLVWLARAKTRRYAKGDLSAFAALAGVVGGAMNRPRASCWVPAIHNVERWWPSPVLAALGRAREAIRRERESAPPRARDLLDVAFCRTMIESANVSFGHQSMSFASAGKAKARGDAADVRARWGAATQAIASAAESPIARGPSVRQADARALASAVKGPFDCVVTSPPYPNRMSYVRELRPYMYWLGYLEDARDAGELDWKAIGGTWGCATSNVAKWSPSPSSAGVPYGPFAEIVGAIRAKSDVLARYVEKYFHDAVKHAASVYEVAAKGASIHYIVGNSKFYDVVLPVESIYAAVFEHAGFAHSRVTTIRKRSSKKELYEFVVSAKKP